MVAPSKRNCRIAQRIARTPKRARGAHTRSSCSRNITVWQVVSRHIQRRLNHRNLAGTPAHGASIASTTTRPWPCAIQPTTRAPRQLVARLNIKHHSIWGASHAHQMEALQTDEQITTIKQHGAAAGRARHRQRSLKTAGVEVRSSSRTSTSTRNPRSTPTHPHSTRKSPKTDASQRLFRTSIDRLRNHTPGFQEIRASLLDPIHSLALIQSVPQTKTLKAVTGNQSTRERLLKHI